jgi:hypothetical protein
MRLKWEYMLTAVFLTFAVIFLLLIALQINLGKNYRAQKLEAWLCTTFDVSATI